MRVLPHTASLCLAALLSLSFVECSCSRGAEAESKQSSPAASAARPGQPAPMSSIVVDHGELDTVAPNDSPRLAATIIATTVYKLPNTESRKLGYIRLGGIVERDPEPVPGQGCKKQWYRIYPMGHVCTDEATTDLEEPLVRATQRRPDLKKPLPYHYGFVRATAPQYLRVPTQKEQDKSEFKLGEHIEWYEANKAEVQRVILGANDVPLDERGMPKKGLSHPPGHRLSTELSLDELFGADKVDLPVPFWLEGGRKIPNVSGFAVPDYALFASRVRRKTGLSFVDAFVADDNGFKRHFGVTVDMRLIPTTKVKPDTGSPFHGVEVTDKMPMPFAWILNDNVSQYRIPSDGSAARADGTVPKRVIVPLSGKARIAGGKRYYQAAKDDTLYLAADDLGIVAPPPSWPEYAEKGEKWVGISLRQQTLVLYEGKKPVYATLVSTGRDRLGDPKTTLATPQGSFRIRSKHIAAAMMDVAGGGGLAGTPASSPVEVKPDAAATLARIQKAQKEGKKLGVDDQRRLANIEKGRDPEYGVTVRRGAADFELRDVPWIQYFMAGYALHGAYWHDVFGVPRSHGCVNLSPIDARVVFMWTDPPIPQGWHGINIGPDMGEGTGIHIHE